MTSNDRRVNYNNLYDIEEIRLKHEVRPLSMTVAYVSIAM